MSATNGCDHLCKENKESLYEMVLDGVHYIKRRISMKYHVVPITIQCGTGLGHLVDELDDVEIVPYHDIPHIVQPKVPGHKGNMVFGRLNGNTVCCLQGRVHPYEGEALEHITLPIRILSRMGSQILILTNATGGIAKHLSVGDVVCLEDHFAIAMMALNNPLVHLSHTDLSLLAGENMGKDKRFLPTDNLYDSELRNLALNVARKSPYSSKVKTGIFAFQTGPQFESPIETRFFRSLNIACAGMSVAHEAIVGKHSGMKILTMSLITNMCSDRIHESSEEVESISLGMKKTQLKTSLINGVMTDSHHNTHHQRDVHQSVQEAGRNASEMMQYLVREIVGKIHVNDN
ncbi:hypothetical protein SNEBB_000187 [Seison nebaliae]|nr:hypothetical protein SNEBB_000187 [Seison nebaliae]